MCSLEDSWIGLYKYTSSDTDPDPSGQYWLDGSTSTFRRWKLGEPNGDENCIGMRHSVGEFQDKDCDKEYAFVCKKTGG